MGPCTVQSAAKGNVTIDKHRFSSPVRLDQMTKMPRMRNSTENIAGLHDIAGQSEPSMQKYREENIFAMPNPNDQKPAKYRADQTVGDCATENPGPYKIPWYA